MAEQNKAIFSMTMRGVAALTAARFVAHSGVTASAGGNALGVARMSTAVNELNTVDVIGTALVESGAAIAANSLVEADSLGRAITRVSGVALGRLAPGAVATGAGQRLEMILIVN